MIIFCGAVSYFIVFARFPVLRDFPWVNLPVVLIGFVVAVVAAWRPFAQPRVYGGKVLAIVSFILSLFIAALFNSYVFYISYQLPPPSSLTTNLDVAPDFVLPDAHGKPVRLSDFQGRKVVLTFYRGHW